MSSTFAWPDSLFAAPILRGLDDAGRRALEGAGRLRSYAAGEEIFAADALSDGLFIVESGEVEVRARAREGLGEEPVVVRVARSGESFGEESALVHDGRRSVGARARTPARVAEIPASLFRRALGRSGSELEEASPEQRLLRRRATASLLAQIPLTASLPERERERLLDAAAPEFRGRGEVVFERGDAPDGLWLLADGLVQLQSKGVDGEEVVQAYLKSGDMFGDGELLGGETRSLRAVAMGHCQLLRVEIGAYRELIDRHPELLGRARRITELRDERQAAAVADAPSTTRHVFADLYRMQMARSLLTIDQDACVRCGHCAWSCAEVHGVARLVRRGDKIVTRLKVLDAAGPASGSARELLLPNSCQHCKNPSCMLDCPTGAIGREPGGEVFIREELCTGCGACAKACPWENIRMAPRDSPGSEPAQAFAPSLRAAADRRGLSLTEMFPEVATKCDSCRGYEAPACVQSCPTGAIVRLEPEREFSEVAAFLGTDAGPSEGARAGAWVQTRAWLRERGGALAVSLGGAAALALSVVAVVAHGRGLWSPGVGAGYVGGLSAAMAMVALVAHAVPKRRVMLWMTPRRAGARAEAERSAGTGARSKVRPFYRAHLVLGVLTPALVLAHTGLRLPANASGVLALLAWLTLALGAFGGIGYGLIPPVLTRLERRGALPEDLARERERLEDRLQRALSGKSRVLKSLARERLLPWARAPGGSLWMIVQGRGLRAVQTELEARVEGWLPAELRREGRQPEARGEALAGLSELVEVCVELRALWARRALTAVLRGWLGPHVIATGALMVALTVHVWVMSGGLHWLGGGS